MGILHDDSTVFDYLVVKHVDFGRQHPVVKSNVQIVTMTDEVYEAFCFAGMWTGMDMTDKVLVVPQNFDLTCNGKFGSTADYLWVIPWCGMQAEALIRSFTNFPGLWSYGHKGHYEFLYEMDPGLRNCTMLAFHPITKEQVDLVEMGRNWSANVRVDYWTDSNYALEVYDKWFVQVFFRIFLALGYIVVAVMALVFLIRRIRLQKATYIHGLVLTVNAISMTILGVLEAMGQKFIAKTLETQIVNCFYPLLMGTNVATDLLVCILYKRVRWYHSRHIVENKAETRRIERNTKLTVAFAVVVLLFDWIMVALLSFLTDHMQHLLQVLIPAVYTFVQVVTIYLLATEMRKMVDFLTIDDEQNILGNLDVFKKLAARLSFWARVQIGVGSATVLLVFVQVFKYERQSPWHYVGIWGILSAMRVLTGLSQIMFAAPGPRMKKNASVTPKNVMIED